MNLSDGVTVAEYCPGYGKVAAYIDTDPSFLVFRKFGWLHNYVLLDLQDELQDLEDRLEKHDKNVNEADGDRRLRSRRLDAVSANSRCKLVSIIHKKLTKYGKSFLN